MFERALSEVHSRVSRSSASIHLPFIFLSHRSQVVRPHLDPAPMPEDKRFTRTVEEVTMLGPKRVPIAITLFLIPDVTASSQTS